MPTNKLVNMYVESSNRIIRRQKIIYHTLAQEMYNKIKLCFKMEAFLYLFDIHQHDIGLSSILVK